MQKEKRIIVIKIGSSVIFTRRKKMDEFRLIHIADQITKLQKLGVDSVLVISGAVAYGANFIDVSKHRFNFWQSAAGVGQAYLLANIVGIFRQKKLTIAQILLRKSDLVNETVRTQFRKNLEIYFKLKIIPVLNENDVIDLNSFGGNDYLASDIASLLRADQLLILSTDEGSIFGVGKGRAKKEVSRILATQNIKTIIANGKLKNVILNHVTMF